MAQRSAVATSWSPRTRRFQVVNCFMSVYPLRLPSVTSVKVPQINGPALATPVIDLLAKRLPDDQPFYPIWTIRCTWGTENGSYEVVKTYHRALDWPNAMDRAQIILHCYQYSTTPPLRRVDVLRADENWVRVHRASTSLLYPRFAFQRRPGRPS